MFNNDLFSDVKFVVQSADGERERKQVIPAHKFVLSISSPVFEAMFYGELAETGDSIELPDCEYESLLELFRYMYSDEVNLNGSNVMEVLYLANKYMVPSLAVKCTKFLEYQLEPSSVFSILPFAERYHEKNLVDQCWKAIDREAEEAVKSDGFATIERSLLEAVVVRDTLAIEEIELFKAVDLWAAKECERQGLAADGAIKRGILGEEVVEGIRFSTMTLGDFTNVVLHSEILKPNEIDIIIKYLSSVPRSPEVFPETKKFGFGGEIQRCFRFDSLLSRFPRYYGRYTYDAIRFSANKDIVLHGVCLFGSENGTYSVDLKVKDIGGAVLASKTGQFSATFFQRQKYNYDGFEVLFDEKIRLDIFSTHELWTRIIGPHSISGQNSNASVKCRGVTFTFINFDTNEHNQSRGKVIVQYGQFPEMLFSLI